jgi:hypothetical protein
MLQAARPPASVSSMANKMNTFMIAPPARSRSAANQDSGDNALFPRHLGESDGSAHHGRWAHAHRRDAIEAREVAPAAETGTLLPGAQFADAFRLALPGSALDAPTAARRMVGRLPRWASRLMTLRNSIVAPFGLKRPASAPAGSSDRIGIFPILAQTSDRIVLGLDDKHLDFRLVVDVAPIDGGQSVTATTIVKTHNLLGRTYLATIMPFHRIIARTMVGQAADR